MKIIQEKPIDVVYMNELEEIAKWYGEDLDFALKQAISLHHRQIKFPEERSKHVARKNIYQHIRTCTNSSGQTCN